MIRKQLFRITSRRDRLVGALGGGTVWHAGNQALDYAKEFVLSDFEEPGDDDVVRKVLG